MFLLIIITASVLYLCAHLPPPPPPPSFLYWPGMGIEERVWEDLGGVQRASIPSTHCFVVVFIVTKYFGALTLIRT